MILIKLLNLNWEDFIDQTLSLIARCDENIYNKFGAFHLVCNRCGEKIEYRNEHLIDIKTENNFRTNPCTIKEIIDEYLIRSNNQKLCFIMIPVKYPVKAMNRL